MSIPLGIPESVRFATAGYGWQPVADGESGAAVFRLHAQGRPTLFLKCGNGRVADGITAEMARLHWLAGRLPVPAVQHFVCAPGEAYLLTTAVHGRSAREYIIEHPEQQLHTAAVLAWQTPTRISRSCGATSGSLAETFSMRCGRRTALRRRMSARWGFICAWMNSSEWCRLAARPTTAHSRPTNCRSRRVAPCTRPEGEHLTIGHSLAIN